MTKRTNNKNSKNNTDKFIMQPKVDYCFKEIMKDMDVLKGFLSAVLNINPTDIKSIELKPTELRKLSKDDKYASKISKEYSETTLYDWGKFFSIESEKELKEMYGKNEYIDKACDHIVELSADEMKKIEYDERFKALCDYNTQMNYNYNKGVEDGVQKGITQGIQQGIDMTMIDLIQTKLAKNMSIAEIAKELEKSEDIITEYINQIEIMNS